ncbi:DUF3102 domain-containing protein [Phyllobacterium chamaecytisi]|uniref:DUF3102 domain-containing protein n=1 Tax=Phyllobacterium chamaecytisi TaxID=2876082 RepID=UPI001CCE3BF8|nr:DUF3102 domain-containing protein [Phyllobacterium sp. KW56]MBZ9603950.1 DUF3102 domain-containing protein [Phyllobacterium sp. KW56]
MLTEIEIEDVGTYRLPNMWQTRRLSRMPRHNRRIAPLAMGLGLSYQQFRGLTPEQQEATQRAYMALTSPANIDPIEQPRDANVRTVAFRPRIHRTDEEKVEIGQYLLQVKKSLPRGHFGPWVENEAGISSATARLCMRLAKEAA